MERIPSEKEIRQQGRKVFQGKIRFLILACREHLKGRITQNTMIYLIDKCRNDLAISSDKVVDGLLKKCSEKEKSHEAVR
jgi:hypothetical protein